MICTRQTTLAIVVLAVGLTGLSGCSSSSTTPGEGAAAASEQAEAVAAPAAAFATPPANGREALQRMTAVYSKAASYADQGVVRLIVDRTPEPIDQTADFSAAFVRPNKVRMQAYQAKLVCDGTQLFAALDNLPGQVVARPSPAEFTMKRLFADQVLAAAMMQGFAGAPAQLMLLMEKDPLSVLLAQAEEPALGKSGSIEGRQCYRVEIKRPDGRAVFWIDEESYVLRRVVFPVDDLRQTLSQGATVKSISLVADFRGAQLNAAVDPKAFQFEAPADAKLVKYFAVPHPAQLLGQKMPPFKFVDLAGKPVTPESMAGKVAVIDFWATWCGPCRAGLPNLDKIRQQYQENDRVVFAAVSVDQPEVKDEALTQMFQELGVGLPILRDPEQGAGRLFNTTGIPTTFLIDGNGVVQDYEMGSNPKLNTVLPEKLEKILAGQNVFEEPLKQYKEQLVRYEQALENPDAADDAAPDQQQIPQAKIAERSAPTAMKLAPLWKSSDVKSPGNILVVPSVGGPPRLLVVDGWKAVAEVGLDGKLIATHPLDIGQGGVVSNLRTFTAANGKRYVAAFASAQQQFHLFDANWKRVISYPQDPAQNRHDGIADVQLGDLDGDGTPEVYVGFWGIVGVQAVGLDGKTLWGNRSLANVFRICTLPPTAQAAGSLLCTNESGTLAVIDAKGQRAGEISVTDRLVHTIVSADLGGNGRLAWCGLAAPKLGHNVAIGLDLKGEELWNYPLPAGVQPQPVEPIVAGRITPSGAGQWLLPGPDGSLHIIASDGKPLDHFNYGAALAGLATAAVGGQSLLIVSSTEGLEAWQVDQ